MYYDEKELNSKISRFSSLLELCEDQIERKQFLFEIQAIEKALLLKESQIGSDKIILKTERELISIFEKEGGAEAYQFILINWFNNVLRGELYELDHHKLEHLRKLTRRFKMYIPELAISEIYIDTFQYYVLDNNKNAINELSKEQRHFFLKHIIDPHEDISE